MDRSLGPHLLYVALQGCNDKVRVHDPGRCKLTLYGWRERQARCARLAPYRRSLLRKSRWWHSFAPQLREGSFLLFFATALPAPQFSNIKMSRYRDRYDDTNPQTASFSLLPPCYCSKSMLTSQFGGPFGARQDPHPARRSSQLPAWRTMRATRQRESG